MDGLLRGTWDKQGEQTTRYVGRGRGAVHREQRVMQRTRCHIPQSTRQAALIAAPRPRLGGKACVTKTGPTRLSLPEAGLGYRHAYRVDRICHRRKSRGHSAPLVVKLNEPIAGLTYLLPLGGRVVTVTEFGLRQALETAQASLPGLPPEHKHKRPDKPTAERRLQACAASSLTILKNAAGEDMRRRLTPLSKLQEESLQRLGLEVALYRQLAMQAMGT